MEWNFIETEYPFNCKECSSVVFIYSVLLTALISDLNDRMQEQLGHVVYV